MKFIVASVADTAVPVSATTADGIAVEAQMAVVIIELVPVDTWRKTITLVENAPSDAEKAALLAQYPEGATVILNGFTVEASA